MDDRDLSVRDGAGLDSLGRVETWSASREESRSSCCGSGSSSGDSGQLSRCASTDARFSPI